MATKVKVKRRISGRSNTGITLEAGEPFYNAVSKQLYIGDSETSFPTKHVAQITSDTSAANNVVSFSVGGDSENTYSKTIDNVGNATNAINAINASVAKKLNLKDTDYYGTSDPDDLADFGDDGDVYIMYQN